jgi:hypothetical protein
LMISWVDDVAFQQESIRAYFMTVVMEVKAKMGRRIAWKPRTIKVLPRVSAIEIHKAYAPRRKRWGFCRFWVGYYCAIDAQHRQLSKVTNIQGPPVTSP